MEGYWLLNYNTGKTSGDGIAMLHEGELVGGDLDHLWSGTYERQGPKLTARIGITPVLSSPEEEIMAREHPLIVNLSGYCTDDFARLEGNVEHETDLRFEITMRKCKSSLRSRETAAKAA
jgi:hypothetical protein